jgi:Contractile injection system tube protein
MADNSKSLSKLVIHSFKKNDFKEEDKDRMFTTPINPESFAKNYKVELETSRGHGQSTTDPQYISSVPQELKIDFVLDGTKTLEGYVDKYKKMDVHSQLDALLKCVYDIDQETHRPRFLNVQWGSEINFNCVLSSLDINHTLFNPDGSPLRARVSATFLHYVAPKERGRKERTSSPDLTHQRTVRRGDRLDIMTYKIYNDPRYILQVARVNNISNIRQLKVGSDIYFPPFDKNEN